jgi:NADPH:quinone reductase
MHGWFCDALVGPAGLAWREAPTPEPAAGEVRLRVAAASLNFPDLLVLEGKYQFRPPLPFVPGSEYVGVVEAVGDGVTHLVPGQRAVAIGNSGGFATHAVVPAAQCMPAPDGIPDAHAAAFAFTYGTSWHALVDRGRLQAGETVLVLGAAGGVGSAAVQIAVAQGARVIAAASSAEKCAFCRELGAEVTLDTSREDLREVVKAATGGRGADIVYDPVGGDLAEPAFRSIAWRGRYLVVGFAAGRIPALPFNLPLLKGADIVGVFWGDHVRREPALHRAQMAALVAGYAAGRLRPAIDATLPMSALPQALARMAARQVRGKLVLVNT